MISVSRAAIVVFLILFFVAGSYCTALAQANAPTVLLVSFDGFRYDYVDKHDLRNFKAFRENGAAAEGLIPCYPSLTFPNHYSIVTGMRPEHHGLVDNAFYDSALNISYAIANRQTVGDARFYGGTPLWTLAKQAGMKTASYFWVGTEVTDPARRPDIYHLYDAKVDFKTRVDSVLSWLGRSGKARPNFITLYFNEPDHVSHESGPNSPETHAMLLKMDSVLGYLVEGVKKVKAPVNTILVSDHGMAELLMANETFVFLDELYDVQTKKFKTIVSSSLAHLYIDDTHTLDSMYMLLKSKEDRYKIYKKNELPAHLGYGHHYRIGDLVMIANPQHYIRHSNRKENVQHSRTRQHFGVHGFDPTVVTDMRGIFFAQGPQVKKGEKLGLVRNIDIYPFIAQILHLPVPPIDGDAKALEKIRVGASRIGERRK